MKSQSSVEWSWASFGAQQFGKGLVLCKGSAAARVWLPEVSRDSERMDDELRAALPACEAREGGFAEEVAGGLLAQFERGADVSHIPVLIDDTAPFRQRVLQACHRIRCGEVRSYRELAEEAGAPRGNRAVGNAMATNRLPLLIPCHRVVRSDGALGNYGGGIEMKRWLLEREGALAVL